MAKSRPPAAAAAAAPRQTADSPRGVFKKGVSKRTRRSPARAKLESIAPQLWQCSNTACTNLDKTARERTITGRKAVSDFFGRNKNSTKSIPDDVWGWLCRTCYQRGRYGATARAGVQPHEEANWYLMLIRDQVKCLKIWRPEATFTIQLQAAAEQRYREYCVALERLGGDRAVAEASVTRPGRQSRKKDQLIEDRGQTLRMSHAKYIKENLTGANTSYADIESVLDWMQGEVDDGQMLHLAAIEFLIHPQRDDEPFIDPEQNSAIFTAQRRAALPTGRQEIEPPNSTTFTSDHPVVSTLPTSPGSSFTNSSTKTETNLPGYGNFRPLADYAKPSDSLANIPLYQPPGPIKISLKPSGSRGVALAEVSPSTSSTQAQDERCKKPKVSTLLQILNAET